ncbi:MAG: acyl-CoA dehydrogenase [Hyphomicrobiaceae bacterium]|nr:acyl-CoA dehydrogenase [Hyphomicrobiaceae bacterium]
MTYQAPVDDILTALKTAADLGGRIDAGLYGDLDAETLEAVIAEAGKFGAEVLEPLNKVGDKAGSRLVDGKVVTPEGWAGAYRQFVDQGWGALPCAVEFGGQGLPEIAQMAVAEIWNSANMSFGLCPLLTQGAIHALMIAGTDEQKETYLPRMVSGEWTGTMNLTEPHAGSDLGELRSKAVPNGDGTFRIFGTKIFITYGDHELSDNIVHLVLARLPDAPPGTKGISLFIVPKYLVNADGSKGAHNDVVCAGLEHKLGIHASPTCVMKFGEGDGAIGYLLGAENRGLNTMFHMMNQARLAVGVQGVAISERATQHAEAYARERRQGAKLGGAPGEMVAIIEHADIRRTLLHMKAMTQASRMICYATAGEIDASHLSPDPAARQAAAARGALLTPIAKAFSTDASLEVASMGVQVHGGMGFIEETGAAQYLRDARILPIYEGTNGIQAIDLVTRKLPLGGGAVVKSYLDDLSDMVGEVAASNHADLLRVAEKLGIALKALAHATHWMGEQLKGNPEAALASATPYLRLFGIAAGGAYLGRSAARAAQNGDLNGRAALIARYFAESIASEAPGLAETVTSGAEAVLLATPERLGA